MYIVIVYYYLFMCIVMRPIASSFFFLMIRRPPRSTLDRSSAASDVYKRQLKFSFGILVLGLFAGLWYQHSQLRFFRNFPSKKPVSYTHLRAHETVLDLVCRLLLEKKNNNITNAHINKFNDRDVHDL